ncbi:family 20 glycosylhydrolase [Flavobacterium sp. SUN052]|uniref:glycoside hydrolase family 20 protein n=1 Tax=Flavobacterium sp. SUN052 TaxID=3002441 RepID=UPI00237D68B7|nr:family 20 glycosylhydrolase [Flavobacterium sp. SUN052]MEC4004666.1 family 20 glycosylhydrolase [Flavobacterium sp. SUN052]
MKKLLIILVLGFQFGFSQNKLPLIPYPNSVQQMKGFFVLTNQTVIQADENSFEAKYLKAQIKEITGLELAIRTTSNASSKISLSYFVKSIMTADYQYQLNVSSNKVVIEAESNEGFFYGIQTLLQLIPTNAKTQTRIQCLKIDDKPKYSWRGMHLDCARHFFPKEFVKKYIDYLAMYKFNTIHWHLTDDQGWRIEIKKYPKLTQIGAWRNGSMVGHYSEQKYDSIRYGGFYSQDDIKEVVAYATERHITVVPEIEMPGHAVAALAAYPEYSCTGGPFEVGKQWGVLDDVFCPKEETFTFLEDILTEVMSLFPSQYIHVGGDECPKTRWKNCPHCQTLIKEKGLKDEHELQSYFVQQIEKFVNSKGRKIIGWDEILEGGLAPNAAVMSWRGTEGGIAAAKQKHFVVMTPGGYCYFDHYQGDPKNEPLAIGGYTTVEKVYSFNPTPKELSVDESKYILGAQANLWTEYIPDFKKVEYMIFPRIMALSEVLWGTSNSEKFKDFQSRMLQQFSVLDQKGIQYSKAIFEVTSKTIPKTNSNDVLFSLKSATNSDGIRYTTDGSNPNFNSITYVSPIEITKSQTIKAAYFDKKDQKSALLEQKFYYSKSTGKKITLINQPHENYNSGGAFALVDGIIGDKSKFGRDWLGFSGKDLIAIIDLSKPETINKVLLCVLENRGSWIYYPTKIEVLTSIDGQNFESAVQLNVSEISDVNGEVVLDLKSKKAQFIKIIATNLGKIPDGMPGTGSDAWLFVDEIGVE